MFIQCKVIHRTFNKQTECHELSAFVEVVQ